MISERELEIARDKFRRASTELNFRLISPYCLDESMGLYAFAFMPDYGSKNGALILLSKPPDYNRDTEIIEWANKHEYFCSVFDIEPLLDEYNTEYFLDILDDWKIT